MISVTAIHIGPGLNDMTAQRPDDFVIEARYTIEIDHTGTPDSFRWKKADGLWTEDVSMTGAWQILIDGVQIKFTATTGHTLADQWLIVIDGEAQWGQLQRTPARAAHTPTVLDLNGVEGPDFGGLESAHSNIVIGKKNIGTYQTIEGEEIVTKTQYQDRLFVVTKNIEEIPGYEPDTAYYLYLYCFNAENGALVNRVKLDYSFIDENPFSAILNDFIYDGLFCVGEKIILGFVGETLVVLPQRFKIAFYVFDFDGNYVDSISSIIYVLESGMTASIFACYCSNGTNIFAQTWVGGERVDPLPILYFGSMRFYKFNVSSNTITAGTNYDNCQVGHSPPNLVMACTEQFIIASKGRVPAINYTGAPLGLITMDFSLNQLWSLSGDFTKIYAAVHTNSDTEEQYIYIATGNGYVRSYTLLGSLRWERQPLESDCLNLLVYEYMRPFPYLEKIPVVIAIDEVNHRMASFGDTYIDPLHDWTISDSRLTMNENTSHLFPIYDGKGLIYVPASGSMLGYWTSGINRFDTAYEAGIGTGVGTSAASEYLWYAGYGGNIQTITGITTTLEVVKTDPENLATNIPYSQIVKIDFTHSIDYTSINTSSLKVFKLDGASEIDIPYVITNVIDHYVEFRHTDNLWPDGETIYVRLSTAIKSIWNDYLSAQYEFSFTITAVNILDDEDLNMIDTDDDGFLDEVTDLVISEPFETYYENTTVYFQPPSVKTPELAWLLHFRLKSYLDAAKTQLLECIDTDANPERFFITSDGVTWQRFPPEGLPKQEYSADRCTIKARILTGRGDKSYVVPFVAADPI